MANLENLSAEDLRQVLAEVEGADAAERVMAAITYKEIDDLTQEEVAPLYGFSGGWASKWFSRLERLETEPFEDVVYDEPRSGRPAELSDLDSIGLIVETNQQFPDPEAAQTIIRDGIVSASG